MRVPMSHVEQLVKRYDTKPAAIVGIGRELFAPILSA
jgi:hypothetical protein